MLEPLPHPSSTVLSFHQLPVRAQSQLGMLTQAMEGSSATVQQGLRLQEALQSRSIKAIISSTT